MLDRMGGGPVSVTALPPSGTYVPALGGRTTAVEAGPSQDRTRAVPGRGKAYYGPERSLWPSEDIERGV